MSASTISKEPLTGQPRRGPKPLLAEKGKGNGEITLLWFFIVGPMVALAAAVPVFWGWGLGWHDVVLGAVFYVIAGPERFAPDLLKDPAMVWLDKHYGYIVASSFLLPTLIGGLWSRSWQGAVTAFFWAGLVRVSLLHHVTFSINSICHMVGDRPFDSGDKAANFWPLAILSFGESWHNSHHTDPSCARHGVLKGQIDITARLIWIFEKLGWAWNVKWPRMEKFDSKRLASA